MKAIKHLITIVIALTVLAGTVFYEGALSSQVVKAVEKEMRVMAFKGGITLIRDNQKITVENESSLKVKDQIETKDTQSAEVDFYENAVLRVGPNSTVVFKKEDRNAGKYVFELKGGQAWINTSLTQINLSVIAGSSMLFPDQAVFDVNYDGSKTDIRVFNNQVGVGLIDLKNIYDKFYSMHDAALINYYLVTQGSQTSVYNDKVQSETDAIAKLLYSKLIKEFQVGFIDKSTLSSDSWYTRNIDLDKIFMNKVSQEVSDKIKSRNLQITDLNSTGYQLKKMLDSFGNLLTFSADKVKQRLLDNLFANLFDAEYFYQYGRSTEAKERLSLFNESFNQEWQNSDGNFQEQILRLLSSSYDELSFVYPEDRLFDVKNSLRDLLLQYLPDNDLNRKFSLIRTDINYAYDLANSDQLNAKLSLERYFRNLGALLNSQKAKIKNTPFMIAEENQVMDNLLRQYALFYQDSFFALKHAWESEWLAMIPEGNAKDEEKQTIISTKIDFLKQLENFFLNNQVPLKEARSIAFRLINEIKDLLSSKDVGINELFAIRLKDYGTFLRFLNSSDIVGLHGTAIQTGYRDFVAQQSEAVSVEEVIKEFMPTNVKKELTVDDINKQIADDFASIEATQLEFNKVTSVDQKLVQIQSGFINNIAFNGTYNWDLKLISNVSVGGKIVAVDPIRLSSLKLLMAPEETSELTQENVNTQQPSGTGTQVSQGTQQTAPRKVSRAEAAGKVLMVQKLKSFGVVALASNITLTDKDKSIYSIQNASLELDPNVIFSFDYYNKEDFATNIVLITKTGQKLITEKIAGVDLNNKMEEFFNTPETQQAADTMQTSGL